MKLSIPFVSRPGSRLGVLVPALMSVGLLAASSGAAAFDEDAAMATLKRNDCTKCHAMEKTKKGPSYKKVAEKLKGKPDAEKKIMDNLTKEPLVKLEDGTEEKHKKIDTTDPKELKNLMDFILSR